MKLVVIYGPPAAGKLTVAKELAKITGYKVLHNHLVIDLVESVFPRDSPMFWNLIDSYRLDLIGKAAANNEKGVILTSVNINGKDDEFIKNMIKTTADNKGETHFIRLICETNEIKRRLVNPSRQKYGKLIDEKIFDRFVSQNDVFAPIPFVESYNINNTDISAEETASKIKKQYKL